MLNATFELDVYQAMLAEFADYVISDVVYWQLSQVGSFFNPFPKLTIGGILLQEQKLSGLGEQLTSAEKNRYANLRQQQKTLFEKWYSNLRKKGLHELQGRMKSWLWFLEDLEENPHTAMRNYNTEVNARVYLELLLELFPEDTRAEQERLQLYDNRLRAKLAPGKFIWQSELQPAFDAQRFWFLYLKEQ